MSALRPLRDFALAAGFLTALPVGRSWPEGGAADAVGFYPWVGALLGAGAVALAWVAVLAKATTGPKGLLAGAIIVAAWAGATRMLHWDGLADTADGLWGSHVPARRLEIMRDSRVGSFGATVVTLTAVLQSAAVAAVLAEGRWTWVLVCAPVLGRAGVSLAAWTLPSARSDGLGLTAVGRPSAYAVLVAVAALVGVLVLGHLTAPRVAFFATVGAGAVGAVIVPRMLSRRVGGMTGDLFGATVLLVETIVLTAGVLVP